MKILKYVLSKIKLKNSVTYKFYLKCYQILFSIFYIIFIIGITISTLKVYRDLTLEANSQTSQNYKLFEDTLNTLDKISVNISAQPELRAYHLVENLKYPYKISNLLETTIRPYTVIKSLALIYVDTSYELLHNYSFTDVGIQNLETSLQSYKNSKILPKNFSLHNPKDITNRIYTNLSQNITLYFSQVPSSYPVSSRVVFYELNQTELTRQIKNHISENSIYQIYDQNGNLLLQTGNGNIESNFAKFIYQDPFRGNTAIYQIEQSYYYSSFYNQLYFSLFAAILTAIILLYLSYTLARITYRPLAQLSYSLSLDTISGINEIQLLEGIFNDLKSENDKISIQMENQLRVIGEQTIFALIRGEDLRIITERLGQGSTNYLKKLNEYSCYCCVVGVIDDYIHTFIRNRSSKEQWIDKHTIMNFFQDSAEEYGYAFCTDIVNNHSIVILFASRESLSIQNYVYSLCQKTQEFIRSNFEFTMTFSIGWQTEYLKQIYLSYQDADFLTQYILFLGRNTIIDVGKIDTLLKQSGTHYQNFDLQIQHILKEIRSGQEATTIQTISDFFQKLKSSNDITCFRFAYIDLLTALKKLLNQEETNLSEIYFYQLEQQYNIEQRSIDEIEEYISHICTNICKNFPVGHSENNSFEERYHKILNYITENLSDPNLCLNMISDYFSMNPSYLTRLFKSMSGKTLMKYVDELRFENSKTLLINTNFPIKDIVRQVGYIDENNFSRKFRLREGISPQKYRELYRD